ncbi:MAG: hypothetical protein ABI591_11720 [Kofleriaceae bacterium]
MRFVKASLPVLAILLSHATAHADDDHETQAPPPPGQPMPVYVAPLSQQTQTTYVPQSVALSGPDEIDAEEGRRAPLGYTPVQRTRKGMLIGGGVTLGVSYMYAALFAATGADEANYSYDGTQATNRYEALWIPVAGPFIEISQTDSATARLALAGLGTAQVIGAVMLYYGLTTTKKVYVRNDLVGNLSITPIAGNGASGMALSGRF